MQINSTNNVSFKGVIPVRVLQNGQEVFEKNVIRKSCLKAIKALSGPLHENPQYKPIAAQLAVMDSDYSYIKAFLGYSNLFKKNTTSDFFKIIFDKNGRGYITTGQTSEILAEAGKKIGLAKRDAGINNLQNSLKVEEAKENYRKTVIAIGNNANLRIHEGFNPQTKTRFGKSQQLDLHINTHQGIKKGKETINVLLKNIKFSDKLPF